MNMLYELVQGISTIVEVYIGYALVNFFEEEKTRNSGKVTVLVWSCIIGILVSINRSMTGLISWAMLILQSIFMLLTVWKKVNTDRWFVFNSILAYNVSLALFQLLFAFVMFTVLSKVTIEELYFEDGVYKSGCYVLALGVSYIIYLLIRKYVKNVLHDLTMFRWLFFFYSIAGISIIAIFQDQILTYGKSGSAKNLYLLLVIICTTFFSLILSIKNMESQVEFKLLGMKNELLKNNYQEISDIYHNYIYTYHDMKNHLIILENYCKSGDDDKALKYIEKIQEPIKMVKQYINTGNEILDMILNVKLQDAEKKGIVVETVIDNVKLIELGEDELCVVFSNLLDNAIEACEKLERKEKWIRILVKKMETMLLINVSNSCDETVNGNEEGDNPQKKGVHGYGLKSVESKVKKYSGNINWSVNEGIYTVTITMFNI